MNFQHVVAILAWTPFCLSWTSSVGVGVDLAYPPLIKEGYITINSQLVGDDNVSQFPCADEVLTGNEPRVIFPITGGQLQWNLTNTTGSSPEYYFVINLYIGQISADTSQFRNQTKYITTDVWKDFITRTECGGETMNATKLVNAALNTNFGDKDVVGMNATIGTRSVLFTSAYDYDYPADIYNIEEMYQCGYVKFVSDDTPVADFGGACISVSTSSTSKPSTSLTTQLRAGGIATTTRTSNTRSQTTSKTTLRSSSNALTPHPSSSTASTTSSVTPIPGSTNSNSQSTNVSTIGIGVGVSVGVSSILIILGYLLFRRRRKHGGTLALDFWVHGRENHEAAESEDKKKEKGKDLKECEDSVHLEPLPAYEASAQSGDVILKAGPRVQT